MHYLIQCHAKMLRNITPQDVFNLILEDTHSAFSGLPNSSNKENSADEDSVAAGSRRESRQSYKHLMINLSSFRAVLQPLDAPYLVRTRSEASTYNLPTILDSFGDLPMASAEERGLGNSSPKISDNKTVSRATLAWF
jgi:hypothetical protein